MYKTPIFVPAPPSVYRKRRTGPTANAFQTLTLVSATYDAGEVPPVLTLTFNQAVDASAIDGAQIVVDDGVFTHMIQDGTFGETTQPTPQSVRIVMNELEATFGTDVRLNAGAANGIVAVSGGAQWAGVSALELPFP